LNTFDKSSTLVASAGTIWQFSFSAKALTSPIRIAIGVFDNVIVASRVFMQKYPIFAQNLTIKRYELQLVERKKRYYQSLITSSCSARQNTKKNNKMYNPIEN